MAYTFSQIYVTSWGNKKVQAISVTADAASGAILTGLSVVEAVVGITLQSAATAGFKVKANINSAAAASNGSVFVSSAANGDVFTIVVSGH